MVDISYHRHSKRRQKALKKWYSVLSDYKAGKTAKEIATKNKRTRAWVYWVLRKFKNNEI